MALSTWSSTSSGIWHLWPGRYLHSRVHNHSDVYLFSPLVARRPGKSAQEFRPGSDADATEEWCLRFDPPYGSLSLLAYILLEAATRRHTTHNGLSLPTLPFQKMYLRLAQRSFECGHFFNWGFLFCKDSSLCLIIKNSPACQVTEADLDLLIILPPFPSAEWQGNIITFSKYYFISDLIACLLKLNVTLLAILG